MLRHDQALARVFDMRGNQLIIPALVNELTLHSSTLYGVRAIPRNHVKKPRSVLPSRTSALAEFLKVPAQTLIQHLTNPWLFTAGEDHYLVMTLGEARSTCAQSIENELPSGVPPETLARYATALPYDVAVERIRKLQKRRDRELAAEDLLELLDERWASALIEKDGLDYWLEKSAHVRFRGRSGPFYIYSEP